MNTALRPMPLALVLLLGCGDKPGAPPAGSADPASAAQSATREMDDVVARVASGVPVDPVEAKAKALSDAKSFGVLGVAGETGDQARLASAWSKAAKADAPPPSEPLDEGVRTSGLPTTKIVTVAITPPSPDIDKVLRERELPRLETCYAQGLRKKAGQRGTLDVRLTIDASGTVKESTGDRAAPSPDVAACVRRSLFDARFPAPTELTQVRLEIAFEPGGGVAGAPAKGPTVGGKPIAEVKVADLEKALTAAGCTEVKNDPKPKSKGARLVTATCEQKTFAITFVPHDGKGDELDVDEVTRLVRVAALHRDGPFFLAVEHTDKAAAEALLARIVENR